MNTTPPTTVGCVQAAAKLADLVVAAGEIRNGVAAAFAQPSAVRGLGQSQTVGKQLLRQIVTSKAPGRGTGLGLAITRTLAREDDGDVQLEEAAGGGLRAVVHWPLATRTGA